MSTATIRMAQPVVAVPQGDQKVAFAYALRQKAATAGQWIAAVPTRALGMLKRVMKFLHLEGVYDWGAGIGRWLMEHTSPARGVIKAIGVIPLAVLTATTKTGQAIVKSVVKGAAKPFGWLYRGFRKAVEWTLGRFGKTGQEAQARFANTMNNFEVKVLARYGKATDKVSTWMDPESTPVSLAREAAIVTAGIRIARRYTTGWLRYALYVAALLIPTSGTTVKALEKARKKEHKPVDPEVVEHMRDAVPTPIRQRIELATEVVEGAMPHVDVVKHTDADGKTVAETVAGPGEPVTITSAQRNYPARPQGSKKRNK